MTMGQQTKPTKVGLKQCLSRAILDSLRFMNLILSDKSPFFLRFSIT